MGLRSYVKRKVGGYIKETENIQKGWEEEEAEKSGRPIPIGNFKGETFIAPERVEPEEKRGSFIPGPHMSEAYERMKKEERAEALEARKVSLEERKIKREEAESKHKRTRETLKGLTGLLEGTAKTGMRGSKALTIVPVKKNLSPYKVGGGSSLFPSPKLAAPRVNASLLSLGVRPPRASSRKTVQVPGVGQMKRYRLF